MCMYQHQQIQNHFWHRTDTNIYCCCFFLLTSTTTTFYYKQVGAKNVEMLVAMQTSAPVKAFPNVLNVSKQLSRFHSVCKDGETNSETGEVRTFYGSPGELCALCPVGAICQRESYAQPQSKAGGYSFIVHVAPVSVRSVWYRCTCKHQQTQDQRWDSYSCNFFMFVFFLNTTNTMDHHS